MGPRQTGTPVDVKRRVTLDSFNVQAPEHGPKALPEVPVHETIRHRVTTCGHVR